MCKSGVFLFLVSLQLFKSAMPFDFDRVPYTDLKERCTICRDRNNNKTKKSKENSLTAHVDLSSIVIYTLISMFVRAHYLFVALNSTPRGCVYFSKNSLLLLMGFI